MADNNENFMVGNISISPQHNTLKTDEHECRIQPKAMAVLHYLAKNSDRVINNDELLDQVWQGRVVTHSSIQKCVNALRTAFTELDDSFEYVVYFSKRGYQLVAPNNNSQNNDQNNDQSNHQNNNQNNRNNNEAKVAGNWSWKRGLLLVVCAIFLIIIAYVIYLTVPVSEHSDSVANVHAAHQFTQVKPYVSNTGREQIIEPHSSSNRVALIRDEVVTEAPIELANKLSELPNEKHTYKESRLFIQGTNGHEWQVSIARGQFVGLAWSPSGRNLVAIEIHTESDSTSNQNTFKEQVNYYTLHIYTLDYKGEKVIEKNLLSYWLGKVSSISWWSEGELEFVASQGDSFERARYRYGIADQNLSKVQSPVAEGQLLTSQLLNRKTVEHRLLPTGEQVRFLNKDQQVMGKWSIPFKVNSISWLPNQEGVLLLSGSNQLSILYIDGTLLPIEYSPKVSGDILRARSIKNGNNIVLTVEVPASITQDRFMKKGGGFIYSAANNP